MMFLFMVAIGKSKHFTIASVCVHIPFAHAHYTLWINSSWALNFIHQIIPNFDRIQLHVCYSTITGSLLTGSIQGLEHLESS